MVVEVNNTKWTHEIGKQLLSIRHFLINEKVEDELNELELDFSKYSFSPPLLSMFYAVFIEGRDNSESINLEKNGYLSYLHFPEGIIPDEVDDWKLELNKYSSKSYLPLIRFSTSRLDKDTEDRNNLISHVNSMIKARTGIPTNLFSAISYLISEFTDNIVDHAKRDRGWISFQYYDKPKFIDLCIGDSGIGLLGSYQEYAGEKDFSNITNHLEALENVIKGNSTKKEDERGFGVHTSREILIDGLGGKFVIFSGNAVMVNYKLFDFKCYLNGTIAMFRIPINKEIQDFNVSNYTE